MVRLQKRTGDKQLELDRQHLRNAQLLEETFNTRGWKEIAEPILSKMIADVVGYKKKDGSWDSGAFGDKRLGEVRADRLLWYRQFGIDYINHLHSFFNVARAAEKRLEARKKDKKLAVPLMDSVYNIDDSTPTTGMKRDG